MRKYLFFISFFLSSIMTYGQCPVSVQIIADSPNPVCRNTAVELTADATNAGSSPQYFWLLDGDTLSRDTAITVSMDFAEVKLILISSNGCPQDTAEANYQIVNTTLVADYEVLITECNQSVADVEITGVRGNPLSNTPFSYQFLIEGGNLGQQELYKDVSVSNYPLYIIDSKGCSDTTWINMNSASCPLPIPIEVITPNKDGYNDVWRINNIEKYPNNEVFIFDRWGQRVYHKKEYDNSDGWDAKYFGLDMPVSTYYYVLKVTLEKSEDLVFKGPISVFR